MKERPTSVTVFAVINLVFCSLGVIALIAWLLSKLGLSLNIFPQPPEKDALTLAMENSLPFQWFSDISSGVGAFTTILLIAASIAMFTLKPWSRKVTIGLGVYSVVVIIVGYIFQYLVIWSPLLPDVTGTDLLIVRAAMIIGGVISVLFIGYHLLMIFMLTRPAVVEAFTPMPHEDGQDGWDDEPSGGDNDL